MSRTLFGDDAPRDSVQSPVVRNTPGLVRRSAPATSHDAAARVKTGTARMRVLQLIIEAGERGLIDEEMQQEVPPNSQRPRRKELEQDGYITTAGVRKTSTGSASRVWVATYAGKMALEQAEGQA